MVRKNKLNFAKIKTSLKDSVKGFGRHLRHGKKRTPLIEVLVTFIILDCINVLFFPTQLGFLGVKFHPYWIPILLISSRYGFIPAVAVSFVSALHYLCFTFGGMPSRLQLEKASDDQGLLLVILFAVVGMIIGEIRQQYIYNEDESKDLLKDRDETLKRLKQHFESSEKAKQVLEQRIVGESTTVKTLYSAAQKLETMVTAHVYTGCLEILKEHFQVQQSSLYVLEGDDFILKAASGWEEGKAAEGRIHKEKTMMYLVLNQNKLMTAKDIVAIPESHRYIHEYGTVLAMVPVKDAKGKPLGVVNIEKIDFMQYNKPNLELINLVVDWACQTLRNIEQYQAAKSQIIYDEEEGVYEYRHLDKLLHQEFNRSKEFQNPFTLTLVKIKGFGFMNSTTQSLIAKSLVAFLKKHTAQMDAIVRHRFEGIYVVLSPGRKKPDIERIGKSLTQDIQEAIGKGDLVFSSVERKDSFSNPQEMMQEALKGCGLKGAMN